MEIRFPESEENSFSCQGFAERILQLYASPTFSEQAGTQEYYLSIDALCKDTAKFLAEQVTPCAKKKGIETVFHPAGFLMSFWARTSNDVILLPVNSEDEHVRHGCHRLEPTMKDMCSCLIDQPEKDFCQLFDEGEEVLHRFLESLNDFWKLYLEYTREATQKGLDFFHGLHDITSDCFIAKMNNSLPCWSESAHYASFLHSNARIFSRGAKLDLDWMGLSSTDIYSMYNVLRGDDALFRMLRSETLNSSVRSNALELKTCLIQLHQTWTDDTTLKEFHHFPEDILTPFVRALHQWLTIVSNQRLLIDTFADLAELDASLTSDTGLYFNLSLSEINLAREACIIDIKKLGGEAELDAYHRVHSRAGTPDQLFSSGAESEGGQEGHVLATQSTDNSEEEDVDTVVSTRSYPATP